MGTHKTKYGCILTSHGCTVQSSETQCKRALTEDAGLSDYANVPRLRLLLYAASLCAPLPLRFEQNSISLYVHKKFSLAPQDRLSLVTTGDLQFP